MEPRRSTRLTKPSLKALEAMASATVTKTATKATNAATRKRKASGTAAPPATKKTKATKEEPGTKDAAKEKAVARRPKAEDPPASKKRKVVPDINEPPTKRLKLFVFGDGESGELGLGAKGRVTNIARPKLNDKLLPADVGIVQVAPGGMHAAAITHDHKILTWGVNDQYALGRDTTYDEDEDRSDVDSECMMSPLESTPAAADTSKVPEGTRWARIQCGDSSTFAVTTTGLVYGCGTFRSGDGTKRFSPTVEEQQIFAQVAGLKDIVDVACGANHALALDKNGHVFSWGWGQQMQLGRRLVERHAMRSLEPSRVGISRKRITAIAAGSDHSFAIDVDGNVWAWGINSFCETGVDLSVGEDSAAVAVPTRVDGLRGKNIVAIAGGTHHSIAVDAKGNLWSFGRSDGNQSGIDIAELAKRDPDAVVRDDKDRPRIIKTPTQVPGLAKVVSIAVGIDTNTVVDASGAAYSWGFSSSNQTGLGTEDDVAEPTKLEAKSIASEKLVWAGAGGQYGMVASEA